MKTKKKDIIELPADPFERASQAVAAMKTLKEKGTAALAALGSLDQALVGAANALDASRGITIRMGAQMPEQSRFLGEMAIDHHAVVSEFRKAREECFRLAKSLEAVLQAVLDGLPKS